MPAGGGRSGRGTHGKGSPPRRAARRRRAGRVLQRGLQGERPFRCYGRSVNAHRHHRREALHCCPACAASVLGRPRRRATDLRPWLWVTLLGLVAALVPLAAMEAGGGPAVAQAAIAPPVSPILEPAVPVPAVP